MSHYTEVTSQKEFDALLIEGIVLVVDFYTKWCGPCKRFAPDFVKKAEELSKENENVKFVKVEADAEDNENVVKKYGISALPTLIVINHKGEKVASMEGTNKKEFNSLVEKAVSSLQSSKKSES